MAPKGRLVQVELGIDGYGKVVIDGKDVSHLTTGVLIRARVGYPTQVRLTMNAVEFAAQVEADKVGRDIE